MHLVTTSTFVTKDQIIRKDNITYHVLKAPIPRWITRCAGLPNTATLLLPAAVAMVRYIRSMKPDIVHGHGTEGAFSLPAIYSRLPNVVSIQGIISEVVKTEPSMRYRIIKGIERHTIRNAMAANPKTQLSAAYVRNLAPWVEQYFIEAAIDKVFWKSAVPPPRENLFFVGTLIKRKGIEEWIKAFVKLKGFFPRLKGYIIGKGEPKYERWLHSLVERMNLMESVHFTGQRDHPEMACFFKRGGVFCLPSYVENSPNVVMEAMAAGLPIVSTDVGDLKKIVHDKKSGLIVRPGNVKSLTGALGHIFERPQLHLEFGAEGRKIATMRWRPEVIAEKHLQMYDSLLKKAGS